jgi:3-oxoacyl-[acyl-carrier protein] reductase
MQKHIIITGASRGIGFETAVTLAENNLRVTAISRSQDKLSELHKKNPEQISVLSLDITSPEATKTVSDYLIEEKLSVDGFIHNAGLLINKPFTKLTDEDWQCQLDVNLKAPVRLTRDLLPYFSKGAHLVNISSMGGFQGSDKFPGLSAYSASKGALSILTECLAVELAERGIAVNCLCFGAVQTEMAEQAFPGIKAPVQPKEMGTYLADFVLNGHRFYNGKILPVALSNPS